MARKRIGGLAAVLTVSLFVTGCDDRPKTPPPAPDDASALNLDELPSAPGPGAFNKDGAASSRSGAHADIYAEDPTKGRATVVRLKTSLGDVLVELDRRKAPLTVENFLSYVRDGYYADTVFHRVLPGVLAQAGGRDAAGKTKPRGPAVAFEGDNGLVHKRGTIAMWRAKDDPDSATTEFFLNLGDNLGRTPGSTDFAFQSRNRGPEAFGYCVFGRIRDAASLVVLEAFAKTATAAHEEYDGESSKPADPPKILAAEIVSQ